MLCSGASYPPKGLLPPAVAIEHGSTTLPAMRSLGGGRPATVISSKVKPGKASAQY